MTGGQLGAKRAAVICAAMSKKNANPLSCQAAQIPHPQPRRWADPKATSDHTGIPVCTLATWRCVDPKRLQSYKIGRKVMYDLNEVDAALSGAVTLSAGAQ